MSNINDLIASTSYDSTDNYLLQESGGSTKSQTGAIMHEDHLTKLAVHKNETGTTYDIIATDTGKVLTFTNAASIAITLPDDLATDFQCSIIQTGAGVPTVTRSGTDTINGGSSGVAPAAQWKAMYLSQYAAGTWLAIV